MLATTTTTTTAANGNHKINNYEIHHRSVKAAR